jgi:hypothetical protein
MGRVRERRESAHRSRWAQGEQRDEVYYGLVMAQLQRELLHEHKIWRGRVAEHADEGLGGCACDDVDRDRARGKIAEVGLHHRSGAKIADAANPST